MTGRVPISLWQTEARGWEGGTRSTEAVQKQLDAAVTPPPKLDTKTACMYIAGRLSLGSQSCGHDRLACKMGSRGKNKKKKKKRWGGRRARGAAVLVAAGGFGKRKMVGLWKQIYLPDYIDLLRTIHALLLPLPPSLSLTHTHTYVHAYKHGLYELYTTYMRKQHPARPRDSKSHQGGRLLDAEQTIRKHRSPVRVGGFQCLSCMSPSTRSCLSRPASGRP